MLNPIALLLTGFFAIHVFKAPGPTNKLPDVLDTAILPQFSLFSQANWGVFIALGCCAIFTIVNNATIRGFEWKIMGLNPTFAYYGGIDVPRRALWAMLISGAVAGLGGAEEVMGVYGAFFDNFSPGYGFDGIAVAMLANFSPIGVIAARGLVRRARQRRRRAADDDGLEQISRGSPAVPDRADPGGAILLGVAERRRTRSGRRRSHRRHQRAGPAPHRRGGLIGSGNPAFDGPDLDAAHSCGARGSADLSGRHAQYRARRVHDRRRLCRRRRGLLQRQPRGGYPRGDRSLDVARGADGACSTSGFGRISSSPARP